MRASGGAVTIRQLLHHTSGVRDYFAIAELAGETGHSFADDDVIDILARQKGLNNAPGADIHPAGDE